MNEPNLRSPDEKYCFECGTLIRARAEICPNCGVRQMAPPLFGAGFAQIGGRRLAAALFALFLGCFGIHKFYLGRPGLGILYILFCWTGIPTLVGWIEGILLLLMSDEEFARKYGSATL